MRGSALPATAIIPLLLILGAGVSCSVEDDQTQAAETYVRIDPRLQSVRDLVAQEVSVGNTPSLSVAVALNGEVVWEEAFGLADKEAGTPATPHTLYRLGSISKPITATAVLRLVETGLVDLDAPIEQYLGGLALHYFVGSPADVTVRRVLQHRAGLPPHNQLFFLDEEPRRRPFRETVRRYGNVMFEPGQSSIYANLGYQLLARLVEHVSGMPFPRYVRDSVFSPLGMRAAQVYAGGDLPRHAARSYFGDNGEPVPHNTSAYFGNGDVYCSAHDLLRFAMFHLTNKLPDQRAVLGNSTIEAMQREEPPSNTEYGLGWIFDVDDLGYRLVYHGGQTTGASNLMVMTPSENLAYVILSNTDYDPQKLLHIHHAIRAALISGYAEAHLSGSDSETDDADERPRDEIPAQRFPEELLGTWRGRIVAYDREIGVTLVIDNEDGARVGLAGQDEHRIDFSYVSSSFLFGTFPGSIPTPDISRYDHSVRMALVRTGDKLTGEATAVGWREDRRTDCELSSWIELEKESRGHRPPDR